MANDKFKKLPPWMKSEDGEMPMKGKAPAKKKKGKKAKKPAKKC